MFNKREKEFYELIAEADKFAAMVHAGKPTAEASNQFSVLLGMILIAPDASAWIDAVKAALEALAAKLYGNGDRPKWTKIAASAVQIAAFVVTMIRSLKALK